MTSEEFKKLEKLFYDPKTGFVNVNELIRKARENNINLSNAEITKWYKEQSINQIYYEKRKKNYIPIVSPWNSVGVLQADLMDISKFKRHNKNPKNPKSYSFLLVIVDVYSRFSWIFPLMTKSPNEVVKHVKTVIREIKDRYPEANLTFTSDSGSEFLGSVKEYLRDQNVTQFLLDPKDAKSLNKKGIVERLNRTIWGKLKKYMSKYETLKFYDAIEDINFNYNNSMHSTIKIKPAEVFEGKKKPFIKHNYSSNEFAIGDKVRRLVKRKTFDKKSFEPIYSVTIYEIIKPSGNGFILKNLSTEKELKSSFLPRQLIKIENVNNEGREFKKQLDEEKKKDKFVRRMQKEKLDIDKDTGYVKLDKRLIPEKEKRVSKPVKRLKF